MSANRKVHGVRVTKGGKVIEETRKLWLDQAEALVETKRREHPGAVVELLSPPSAPAKVTDDWDPNEDWRDHDRFARRQTDQAAAHREILGKTKREES